MNFVNLTIMLTITAAGILLVKKLLATKITPRGHMLIWLLIAVQILAWPVSEWLPEADWAVRQYVPQLTDSRNFNLDIPPYINDGIQMNGVVIQENTISMTSPVTGGGNKAKYFNHKKRANYCNIIISAIWGTGSFLLFLILAAGAVKQKRKLNGLPVCQNDETLRIFSDMKKRMDMGELVIPLKNGSDATMLAGVLRPTVYLAAGSDFTEEELRHVFAHELTHYKHRDLWLNVLSAGLLCAFWWNPVFWLAFRRFHMDMEVHCDYDAAKVTGDRKAYAHTLVKAAAGKKRFMLATTSLANEEHQVSRRVKALAKFKQPKIWVSVLAVCVLLGVGAGLVVNPELVRPELTTMDAEILHLYVNDSQGDEIFLNLDGKQQEFLQIVNGEWANREIWKNIEEEKGDARDTVFAYYKNWAQPAVTIRFHSLSDFLSSMYIPGENSVKLYTGNSDREKMVLLEKKDGMRYSSDDEVLWDKLMELISEHIAMRDVVFPDAVKGAGWIYEGTLYQTDGAAEWLRDWERNLESSAGTKLSKQEVLQYLENPAFDYWVNLYPGAGGARVMGHPADEPDGEGHTVVIGVNVGSGYVYDDSELAYLLADAVKLQFKSESENHDWRICDGDKSWEEAVELFETQYGQRYSEEELAFLQARNEGTYMEATLPKARIIEVQEVSALENAVRIYWVEEKTYFNDVWDRSSVWAGGGFEYTENPDGSLTMRRSYINHLYNDGEGWYHVNNGFDPNTKMNLNEDGSLKEGLIRY